MKLSVFVWSVLLGSIAYAVTIDHYGATHSTGIAIGLLVAVLMLAVSYCWLLENDSTLRASAHYHRKRRK